jgi:hypothetical protein
MSQDQVNELQRMFFDQVITLINESYRAGKEVDSYLYLDEAENSGKRESLVQIGLFLKGVAQVAAYKFDQVIADRHVTHECYAPVLSDLKGNRSMCDYIVFFRLKNDARINVWAVNMKSRNLGNNLGQLRAAKRVIDFLLGKLEDQIVAETNKPVPDLFTPVNFVLFSTRQKTGTNPQVPPKTATEVSGSDNSGRNPANFYHVTQLACKLQPLL